MQHYLISWNTCGITPTAKMISYIAYVYCHHLNVISIHALGTATQSLTGYTSYVHNAWNVLINSSRSLSLISTPPFSTANSVHLMKTYSQFVETKLEEGTIRLCSVYSSPGRMNFDAQLSPKVHSTVYMGDYNARHPGLGDASILSVVAAHGILSSCATTT